MFYIHDIKDITFRRSLENLEQKKQIGKDREIDSLKYDGKLPQFSGSLQAQAASTYQETLKRKNMLEPLLHVYQLMSSPVSTIRVDLPLIDAWWIMKQENIRQVVVTTTKRKVIGILADKDILKYINVYDDKVYMDHETIVADILVRLVVTTDSMSDIRRVAKVMTHYHLNAIPVMEKEKLVGIVTRGDILRGFAENPKLNLWA